jgi:hypothetical protein
MADALNVEPAVAIAAAAKPIAILRIMILLHLLETHPSPSQLTPAVAIELQRAAVSLGVPASESQLVGGGGGRLACQLVSFYFAAGGNACNPLSTGIGAEPWQNEHRKPSIRQPTLASGRRSAVRMSIARLVRQPGQ